MVRPKSAGTIRVGHWEFKSMLIRNTDGLGTVSMGACFEMRVKFPLRNLYFKEHPPQLRATTVRVKNDLGIGVLWLHEAKAFDEFSSVGIMMLLQNAYNGGECRNRGQDSRIF